MNAEQRAREWLASQDTSSERACKRLEAWFRQVALPALDEDYELNASDPFAVRELNKDAGTVHTAFRLCRERRRALSHRRFTRGVEARRWRERAPLVVKRPRPARSIARRREGHGRPRQANAPPSDQEGEQPPSPALGQRRDDEHVGPTLAGGVG